MRPAIPGWRLSLLYFLLKGRGSSRKLSSIDWPTADKPDWPDFPLLFVKYTHYTQSTPQKMCHGTGSSPQTIEKSDPISLALATVAMLDNLLERSIDTHSTLPECRILLANKC